MLTKKQLESLYGWGACDLAMRLVYLGEIKWQVPADQLLDSVLWRSELERLPSGPTG